MEIILPLWVIPLLITIISFGYALFIHDDGGGYFSGIGNIVLMAPAGIISTIAWMIYAFLT